MGLQSGANKCSATPQGSGFGNRGESLTQRRMSDFRDLKPVRTEADMFSLSEKGNVFFRLCNLTTLCLVGLLIGCQQPRPKQTESEKNKTVNKETAREPPPVKMERAQKPPAENKNATRAGAPPPRSGIPAPENMCGHTIAFAGWRTGLEENAERLLFFDPGDNALEVGSHIHRWNAEPGDSPVYFGRRRPTIVLDPAGAFTICGAVVMTPIGDAKAAEPVESIADTMPDLSQALGEAWPGLCGPTSAADIIYAVGSRRKSLLEDLSRGPSPQANEEASRLIVGLENKIDDRSLAFRMGLEGDGKGVTNTGMRLGLSAWLSDRDPGAWNVDLDWLDDQEKAPESLSRFFRRLEAASRSGGGVILCLWPGSEFADASTDEAEAAQQHAAAAAAAASGKNGKGGSGTTSAPFSREGQKGNVRSRKTESDGGQAANSDQAGVTGEEGGLPGTDGEPQASRTRPVTPEQQSPVTGIPADAEQQATSSDNASSKVFLGRKADPKTVERALQKGLQAIQRAERSKNKGDNAGAIRAAGDAISILRPYAAGNMKCRQALSEAAAIAVALDSAVPQHTPASHSATSFE
jgi:hypothetical protein